MSEIGDTNNLAGESFHVLENRELKVFDRSAVLYEVWTEPTEGEPRVFVLLLHKKQRWWEQPGGGIEGEERSGPYILSQALKELNEEASLRIKRRSKIISMIS